MTRPHVRALVPTRRELVGSNTRGSFADMDADYGTAATGHRQGLRFLHMGGNDGWARDHAHPYHEEVALAHQITEWKQLLTAEHELKQQHRFAHRWAVEPDVRPLRTQQAHTQAATRQEAGS